MRLIYQNKQGNSQWIFEKLEDGQTFILESCVFEECPDVYIKAGGRGCAVDIVSGVLQGIDDNAPIIPVDCKCEVYI